MLSSCLFFLLTAWETQAVSNVTFPILRRTERRALTRSHLRRTSHRHEHRTLECWGGREPRIWLQEPVRILQTTWEYLPNDLPMLSTNYSYNKLSYNNRLLGAQETNKYRNEVKESCVCSSKLALNLRRLSSIAEVTDPARSKHAVSSQRLNPRVAPINTPSYGLALF